MFGSKLKTWMENHIGRPKKKSVQEKEKINRNGGRGTILKSSESLAQSDTGISSGSQQILTSSVTDAKEGGGYCTTTLESEASGTNHDHLTAISLPSPESAYSTGYSTDGASPGGTGPPEYYINIRTGKHYFPSPAPTPTSPRPNSSVFSQFRSGHECIASSFLADDGSSMAPVSATHPSRLPDGCHSSNDPSKSLTNPSSTIRSSRFPSSSSRASGRSNGFSSVLSTFVPENVSPVEIEYKPNVLSTSFPINFEILNYSKSPSKKSQLSSFKSFLKSSKPDKEKVKLDAGKTETFSGKKKILSPMTKNRKWYKQPFHKFGLKQTDLCEDGLKNDVKKDVLFDPKNLYYLAKENVAASPRQRNRIKTNPWLPTEPMSSQNFQNLQINFSPSLTRNKSCTNTPLQNRKSKEVESMQNRLKEMNVRYEASKEYLSNLERIVNSGRKLYLDLSDHSEEDLTLNEMMGNYNESYVYEKETDILSDSDPTDCEDYVSDSEADNGGDERDSHDDELDFIDNGSLIESNDNFTGNTGKCTYHDIYVKKNSFLYKSDRHHSRKDSESRKSIRKEREAKGRKSKEEKKRRLARTKSVKLEEEDSRRQRRNDEKSKSKVGENVGGLNLGRVQAQRETAKNGSKSAEGTPVSIRRENPIKELRETHIGIRKPKEEQSAIRKRRLNENAFLVDVEGDRRYNELITEAENMLQSMQNSPINRSRKKMVSEMAEEKTRRTDKTTESATEVRKRAQKVCSSQESWKENNVTTTFRKSPKNLGLKLTMEDSPKSLKKLELFGKEKKTSFKAKSSAHSPLDPLGPTFRNFTVFKPAKIEVEKLQSSSEESFPDKIENGNMKESKVAADPKSILTCESPMVPIAFQSIDLGKPLTSYCPQSEPVKRKIYSCSKTYDELVKRFENAPKKLFEETERARHGSLMKKKRPEEEAKICRALKNPTRIGGDSCFGKVRDGTSQSGPEKARGRFS